VNSPPCISSSNYQIHCALLSIVKLVWHFKLVVSDYSYLLSFLAAQTNSKLCDRFSVDRYPMLLWGRPRKFASVSSWDGKDGEIESINDGRTAERLLDWINKKLKRYFFASSC